MADQFRNPNECVCGFVGQDAADLETHIGAEAAQGDREHGHKWITGSGGIVAPKPAAGGE
jgi:hypothetical protein